jgi:histidyl-tRNA synthetase
MQNANKANAEYTVLIGSDEIAAGKYKLRSMSDGVEKMVTEKELLEL